MRARRLGALALRLGLAAVLAAAAAWTLRAYRDPAHLLQWLSVLPGCR